MLRLGMILKKIGSNYIIDTKATKVMSEKLKNLAMEIASFQECKLANYRNENALYSVVQKTLNSAYLQNIDTNVIFEEVKFSDELMNSLCNDAVIRYKDGEYILEEELTRKNMNPIS